MLNIYFKNNKSLELKTFKSFKKNTWLNLFEPTEREIANVCKLLKVDEGLINDSLDVHEMPRFEVEEGIFYFYVRVPEKKIDSISTHPLLIAIGSDFILTVSSKKSSLLDRYIESNINFSTEQRLNILLDLLAKINSKYNNYLIDINKRLRSIKVRLEHIDNKDLIKFVDFEQVLNDFLSALMPVDAMMQKMITGRHFVISEDNQDFIEDISLSNKQLIELSKASLRYTINIRDTYSNIATHNLNRIMKILTVLTILLTVPNVIFGFFGMNIAILDNPSPYTYLYIIISTVLVLFSLLLIFIKEKWL